MKYTLTKNNKTLSFALLGIGIIAVIYGFINHPERAWANLLVDTFYFMAIALCGTFFVALNYVAQAGWSVVIKRIPEAMGQFLPYAAVLMLIIYFFGGHHLYHWTHHELFEKFLADGKTPNPEFDKIIAGKSWWLNQPFFIFRLVFYFAVWIGFTYFFRKESLLEDVDGDIKHYKKCFKGGATFVVLFGITSSTSAWDFLMSIDTHWFSTLFGWYTFSGLFVSGLAMLGMLLVYLKSQGYMETVNESHLHDVGKFMFAFSIFWTYLWFDQFMLIWYANLPEEVTYFMARWNNGYKILFITNLLVNFLVPFLVLMSRDAKRKMQVVMIAGIVIFCGHWLDVFLMVMPGTVGKEWGIGFTEIGTLLGMLGLFLFVVLNALTKASLQPQKHPLLQESLHHHI